MSYHAYTHAAAGWSGYFSLTGGDVLFVAADGATYLHRA